MNRAPYRAARILVTGANFACGSSREPAVYALVDAGFRCVIAPSYGEIFFSNCFRNGLLPVVLPSEDVLALWRRLHETPGAEMTVDLGEQCVYGSDVREYRFENDSARKLRLMKGRDNGCIKLSAICPPPSSNGVPVSLKSLSMKSGPAQADPNL